MKAVIQIVPGSAWTALQRAAEEYVDCEENESEVQRKKVLAKVNKFLSIYPNSIDLLATKADYLKRAKDREICLLKAYSMSRKFDDFKNQTLICSSLSSLYIDDLENFIKGNFWVSKLRVALSNYFDEDEQQEFVELEMKLKARLKS